MPQLNDSWYFYSAICLSSVVCCRLTLSLEVITENLRICFSVFRRRCLDSEHTQLHIHSHSTAARCPSLIYCVITTIVTNICVAYAREGEKETERTKEIFILKNVSFGLFILSLLTAAICSTPSVRTMF